MLRYCKFCGKQIDTRNKAPKWIENQNSRLQYRLKYRHLMMLQYDFVQQSPPRSGSVCNYKNEQPDGDKIVTDSGANTKNVKHVEHVASRWEKRNVCANLVGKPEGEKPFGRRTNRRDDNIKIGLYDRKEGHVLRSR